MKQKIFLSMSLIVLIGLAVFVSARMTFVDEDDGIYKMYNNDIILEKGWNLVHFGQELREGSEILEKDIKAIYYYNPTTKNYVRYYPESEEWNNLADQDTCGDSSCSAEERESYASWCYKDCKTELNDDIIANLNVINTKTFTLKKNEKETLNFDKYYDMEVYWDEHLYRDSGSCSERGYSNMDCVMLHHSLTTNSELGGDNEFINSPNDGNPYNDRFGVAYPIGTYTDQESVIYAKVEYGNTDEEFKITFYEIDDKRVKSGYIDLPVPSFGAKIVSQPAWVYSEKRGLLKTEAFSIKAEQNPLQSGWNFVTITPEFDGKSWSQISQDCYVSKAYIFDAERQRWVNLESVYGSGTFGDAAEQGQGIIVKVSSSCYLSTPGGTAPPEIPSGDTEIGDIDCQENDGGKAIGVKGTTTGMDWQGNQVSKTDTCEDHYDNYLREYYCLDNVVQNEGNFCPDGTTCSNGACI